VVTTLATDEALQNTYCLPDKLLENPSAGKPSLLSTSGVLFPKFTSWSAAILIMLFWVKALHQLVGRYQHFREAGCLHSKEDEKSKLL
jgi:hypothetical protein